jgi:hypothetical protein
MTTNQNRNYNLNTQINPLKGCLAKASRKSGVFVFGGVSPNDIQSIASPVVSLDTAANYKLI